jgi:hypothetical protein
LLVITTGIALVFILKGKVREHRQWMTRSFAVALVFLEGRVIGGVTGWENLGVHASETIVWTCLAFSILSADLVLQWQGSRGFQERSGGKTETGPPQANSSAMSDTGTDVERPREYSRA